MPKKVRILMLRTVFFGTKTPKNWYEDVFRTIFRTIRRTKKV